MRGRRFALHIVTIISMCCTLPVAAYADVKITVKFTEMDHDIFPQEHDVSWEQTDQYVLTSDSKITSHSIVNGRIIDDSSVIGAPAQRSSVYDTNIVTRTIIENGALHITRFLYSYIIIINIKTNGHDSCSATREYKLKPGFKTYIGTIGSVEKLTRRIENLTCEISST